MFGNHFVFFKQYEAAGGTPRAPPSGTEIRAFPLCTLIALEPHVGDLPKHHRPGGGQGPFHPAGLPVLYQLTRELFFRVA